MAADPSLWSNNEKAEQLLKELKTHKNWVARFKEIEGLVEETELLYEYQKEGEAKDSDVDLAYNKAISVLDDVEFRTTLNQPEDAFSAILEINAGAGGT